MDESGREYSADEMERMMKVQDVLLKAMAKKISWLAAAEIIGVAPRRMRRWRERLEQDRYKGLADRRKGKPSFRWVPLKTVENVLGLYQEKYYDLNVRHFREKLREEHGIKLSYTWVYQALVGAGLVQKRRKRAAHRRRRTRRPLPGMGIEFDPKYIDVIVQRCPAVSANALMWRSGAGGTDSFFHVGHHDWPVKRVFRSELLNRKGVRDTFTAWRRCSLRAIGA